MTAKDTQGAVDFYTKQGFNVIPIDAETKIPKIRWQKYQNLKIESNITQEWLKQGLFDNGIAIVCGAISNGFCGIDLDNKKLISKHKLNIDKMVKMGYWIEETKRGYHIIARMTDEIPRWENCGKVEFLGEGRLCIIAPSKNKKMINTQLKTPIIDNDFYNKYKEMCGKKKKKQEIKIEDNVKNGERNSTLFDLLRGYDKRGVKENEALILAKEWNDTNTDKLDEAEIIRTLKSVYTKLYFNNKRFMASVLGTEILSKEKFIVITDTQEIWRWNGKYYVPDGLVAIKKYVQQALTTKTTKHYKNEVISYIEDEEDIHVKRSDLDNYPDMLNLENGILNIKTRKLIPHNSEYYFTSQIPIKYNPKAKIKLIQKFWEDLVPLQYIDIMQEFFGDCLQPTYKYKKALLAVGPKHAGKSKVLELLGIFLGKENISHVSLYSICYDRFSIWHLFRKKANIVAQIESGTLKTIGAFLMVTGWDDLYGQRKGMDGFFFKNFAKLIFSCNRMPESKTKGDEWYVRWITVPFSCEFTIKTRDVDIIKNITTPEEMSGLLNWALDGLDRLERNGYYTECMTLDQTREFMNKGINPVMEFIKEHIVSNIANKIEKEKLYNYYKEFCVEMKYPYIANNTFSMKFKDNLPPHFKLSSERKGTKNAWLGIEYVKTASRDGDDELETEQKDINEFVTPNGDKKKAEAEEEIDEDGSAGTPMEDDDDEDLNFKC